MARGLLILVFVATIIVLLGNGLYASFRKGELRTVRARRTVRRSHEPLQYRLGITPLPSRSLWRHRLRWSSRSYLCSSDRTSVREGALAAGSLLDSVSAGLASLLGKQDFVLSEARCSWAR